MIGIIVILIIVGVLLWLVHAIIPMDQRIRTVIDVVVVLCVMIWLLQIFGLIGPLNRPVLTTK